MAAQWISFLPNARPLGWSWIAESWFCGRIGHLIVEIMDREKSTVELADVAAHRTAGQSGSAWSVGKLIELIDAAIDTAGAQLARSAGLWADSPGPFDERRRQQASSARMHLEEPDSDNGISPL